MTAPMTREELDTVVRTVETEYEDSPEWWATFDRVIDAARYGLDMDAEVERLNTEVARQRKVIQDDERYDDMVDKFYAARAAFTNLRDAVIAVHDEHECGCLGGRCTDCPNGRFCNQCGVPAPCPTRAVVEGVDAP